MNQVFEFSNEVTQGEQRPGFSNKTIVKTKVAPGAVNKLKYYLAGADACIKLNTLGDDSEELLTEFFSSEDWQRDINLTLDPMRICLLDSRRKLDISFAEMKILEHDHDRRLQPAGRVQRRDLPDSSGEDLNVGVSRHTTNQELGASILDLGQLSQKDGRRLISQQRGKRHQAS